MSEDPSPGADAEQPAKRIPVEMVRTPRYSVFVISGVLLGVLVAVVLVLTADERAAGFSVGSQLGYLGSVLGLLGGLVGGGAAVLAERFVRPGPDGRRSRR